MANYLTTDTELTSVANAIRTKGGTNALLTWPNGFVDAISNISTGGGTVENAETLYTANTGTKYSITLASDGMYGESWENVSSGLYSYIGSISDKYCMVANSSGNVVWKGILIENSYGTDTGQFFYTYCGGGILISLYSWMDSTGEEDPETGEWIETQTEMYNTDVQTRPIATKVYFSSTAF